MMPLPKAEKVCPGCKAINPNASKVCKCCSAELIKHKLIGKEDFRCSSSQTDIKFQLEKRAHQLWANHNYHIVVLYFADNPRRKRFSSFSTPGRATAYCKLANKPFRSSFQGYMKTYPTNSEHHHPPNAETERDPTLSEDLIGVQTDIDPSNSEHHHPPNAETDTDSTPAEVHDENSGHSETDPTLSEDPINVQTDIESSTSERQHPRNVQKNTNLTPSNVQSPSSVQTRKNPTPLEDGVNVQRDIDPPNSEHHHPPNAETDTDPTLSEDLIGVQTDIDPSNSEHHHPPNAETDTDSTPAEVHDENSGHSDTEKYNSATKRKKSRNHEGNKKQKKMEWNCKFCDGLWSESSRGERWVQCQACNDWAHVACTAGLMLDCYVCDFCS